jgi:hypothetical protein
MLISSCGEACSVALADDKRRNHSGTDCFNETAHNLIKGNVEERNDKWVKRDDDRVTKWVSYDFSHRVLLHVSTIKWQTIGFQSRSMPLGFSFLRHAYAASC